MHLFVLILHIICAGILVGSVTVAVYNTFRSPLNTSKIQVLRSLQVIIPIATYLIIASGIYLFFTNFSHFVYNDLFWAKMILFVIDGFLATFILKKRIDMDLENGEREIKNNLRYLFLLELLLIFLMISLATIIGESH